MSTGRCLRCFRAAVACYCGHVARFELPFTLVLLAHPREAKNRVGSVRIAHLSIPNSELVLSSEYEIDSNAQLRRFLSPEFFPVVLYPGKNAMPLERATAGWIPAGKKLALIVIDGTWSQAKRMMRRSDVLQSLPRVSFVPTRPSEYEIREQPQAFCLSTVEAVHTTIERMAAVGLMMSPEGRKHDRMLEVFRRMVRFQVRCKELGSVPSEATQISNTV